MNNQFKKIILLLFALIAFVGISGCTGVQTFTNFARSGDTISVMYSDVTRLSERGNTIVIIEDSMGTVTKYYPGDARIKAILNMYPDPTSYLVVGTESDQDFRSTESNLGKNYASAGSSGISPFSRSDWFQTVAYIDLPTSVALGTAKVHVEVEGYTTAISTVEIIEGVGTPHDFGFLYRPSSSALNDFQVLERSPNSAVHVRVPSADTSTVQALDVTFSHNPDVDNGGQGRAHVANPRGDIASINWKDDGTTLHVLVTPAHESFKMIDRELKFYVTGGITGLTLQSVAAVDLTGAPVSGVEVLISPLIHSITPGSPIPGETITVSGDNLCSDCVTPDSDVWLRSDSTWVNITPSSVTQSSITVTIPSDISTSNASIWVQTSGGGNSKRFDVQ